MTQQEKEIRKEGLYPMTKRKNKKNISKDRDDIYEIMDTLNDKLKSPTEIADALNYSGHRNALGNKWNGKAVIESMRNRGKNIKGKISSNYGNNPFIDCKPRKIAEPCKVVNYRPDELELPSWV